MTFTITNAMIINADNNELIPQKTRNLDSSKPANGEIIIEKKHKKHSINQPLNRPVIKGAIKGIVFFMHLHPIIIMYAYIIT